MANQVTVGELVYKISGDMDNLTAELKKAEANISDLQASMKSVGKTTDDLAKKTTSSFGEQAKAVFTGAAAYEVFRESVGAVKDFIVESIQKSAEAAAIMEQVKTNVNNAGLAYDDYADKIKVASEAALQLGFDDEESSLSLSKFIVVTKDFTKAQALQNLAMDLARSKNIDLTTATRAVILVTQGNSRALKELGVNISETASVADRLTEAQELVKGSAAGFATTTAGKLEIVKQQWENIKEEVGAKLAPVVEQLFKTFEDNLPQIEQAFEFLAKAIVKTADAIVLAINGLEQLADISKATFSVAAGAATKGVGLVKSGLADLNIGTKESAENTKRLGDAFFSVANDSMDDLDKKSKSTIGVLNDLFGTTKDNTDATKKLDTATKDVTKSTKGAADAFKGIGGASAEATQAAQDAIKAFQDMQGKLLDLKQKTADLAATFGANLVSSVEKFSASLKDAVTTGGSDLANIVIKAQDDLATAQKDLAKELQKAPDSQNADTIASLNDTIKAKQAILASYANFQTDLAAKVAEVQKKADDAVKASATEVDPQKKAALDAQVEGLNAQVVALQGFSDLDKQVAAARVTAGQDEFKQAEVTTFAKIQLLTDQFITETTLLRQKQEIANEVEKSITDFYKQQTKLRQKTLDDFALSSITTLKKIGSEAKATADALNALRSAGAQANGTTPDTTINPASISANTGATTNNSNASTTNNNKTVNAPITVNATIQDSTDPKTLAQQLSWLLSHK